LTQNGTQNTGESEELICVSEEAAVVVANVRALNRFPPCSAGGSLLQKRSKRSRFICAGQLAQITPRCFPASTVFRNSHLWRETLCLQGKSISGGAMATHPKIRRKPGDGQASENRSPEKTDLLRSLLREKTGSKNNKPNLNERTRLRAKEK